MPLKFWLGGAASDKSRQLIKYILEDADKNPTTQYLFVAPEQYGLATQQELVKGSKNKGILNIDVLSFTRLAHRICDEVGSYEAGFTTLDDTGKSLLIGMLASANRKELSVFADNLEKLGYIDKIKSVISEFMQYGITVDKAFEMAEAARSEGRGLLAEKLQDTALIYRMFKDYIKDRYTTVEETLDIVSSLVPHSDTIKNSVVIFDGFTGFTPVQNKLIGVLMEYARDIHVALVYDETEDCIQKNITEGEKTGKSLKLEKHELFYLSKHTMDQLGRMADERQIITADPYKAWKYNISNICNSNNNDVYNKNKARKELNNTSVHIFAGQNPDEEVQMVFSRIMNLVRKKGYRYRDCAILTGDMEGYRYPVEHEFSRHDIPFFIDRTEPVLLNPFIEYIRAFIGIISDNYSQAAVFRFLKSGLTGFGDDEINALENYCLAANIKGYKKWHERFTLLTGSVDAEKLADINEIRERFVTTCDHFMTHLTDTRMNAASRFTIRQFCEALYVLIEADGIEEKLKEAAKGFEECGDRKMYQVYDKIYAKIMDILDELCELIPDEKTDIRVFGNLLDVGLNNIRIGVLPRGMDYIQVGDLTRSRVGDVKALFIIGANDGVIPKVAPGGGIINDNDREFLENIDEKLVLAPGAGQDVYTQQLYIYMAMSRPKEHLFVSYSQVSGSGKSMLPSYIVRKLLGENKDIRVEKRSEPAEEYVDEMQAFDELTDLLYPAISGRCTSEIANKVKELLRHFLGSEKYRPRLERMIQSMIVHAGEESDDTIGAALAHAIYGKRIVSNITKLENYAKCAYRYFLEHGLKLREREIFSFEARDIGNIFHDSMKEYSQLMQQNGKDWLNISEKEREKLMDRAVDKVMGQYRDDKLSSSARYAYMEHRIRRIMRRSADVVSAQLKQGKFIPKYFEVDFDRMDNSSSLSIKLSDDEAMRLRGRIDRVDTYEEDDNIYIRIIDYKSSQHDIDLAAVYEGRQLQLLVYLLATSEGIKSQNEKDGRDVTIRPAGVLYYLIDDPVITANGELTDDEIESQIMGKLRLDGLVNSDKDVLRLMDKDLENTNVLPVKLTSKGAFGSKDPVIDDNGFATLSGYVTKCIKRMSREILAGNIAIPEPDGQDRFTGPDCKYCPYSGICAEKGKSAPEYEEKVRMDDDQWISLMKKKTDEDDT